MRLFAHTAEDIVNQIGEGLPKEDRIEVVNKALEKIAFADEPVITPVVHENSLQTLGRIVSRLDRPTCFAAGMLFAVGLLTFAARR